MDFEIKRDDLHETRVLSADAPAPGEGEALLEVQAFGLTANNVTYAVFGEAMSYWSFFPAEQGWGRMPVWGFSEVAASNVDGLEEGARFYGYMPPSSQLLVKPERVDERGFVDAAAHRADLPPVYNVYARTDADPYYVDGLEDVQMLLRPLFLTSFLLDDFLADEGLAEGTVILSSASSKTAISAAHLLAERDAVHLIGLTSPGRAGFVEGLGLYDEVVPYAEAGSLGGEQAVYVDMSGDAAVRRAVHERFGAGLRHSAVVGATHWEEMDGEAGELPGPQPTLFFAPDRVAKRSSDWGREELDRRAALTTSNL